MIKISSKDEFLQAFRTIDQDEVELPHDVKFPIIVRDYLSWVEPSGHRTYLVVPDQSSGKPLGVVFKKTRAATGDYPAAMCDWCHSVRGGGAVGLMTASVSKTRRVGLTLCRDLSCKDKACQAPGVHDVFESINPGEKVERIVTRMRDFARRNLF